MQTRARWRFDHTASPSSLSSQRAGARQLDVVAMRDAAQRLVGEHNFQNFCKMNVANTTQHVRRVDAAELAPVPLAYAGAQDLIVLHIRGSSFLWHQVRHA